MNPNSTSIRPSHGSRGRAARLVTGALLAAGLCASAAAANRIYPMGSLQGDADFSAFPKVEINCRDYVLGPGVRVYDLKHHLILTGQLKGLSAPIVFQRDALGNIVQVWVITPREAKGPAAPLAPSDCLFGN